jgi:hypothetical protein
MVSLDRVWHLLGALLVLTLLIYFFIKLRSETQIYPELPDN